MRDYGEPEAESIEFSTVLSRTPAEKLESHRVKNIRLFVLIDHSK